MREALVNFKGNQSKKGHSFLCEKYREYNADFYLILTDPPETNLWTPIYGPLL